MRRVVIDPSNFDEIKVSFSGEENFAMRTLLTYCVSLDGDRLAMEVRSAGLDDAGSLRSRLNRRLLALRLHQAEADAENPISSQNAKRH